MVTIPARLQDVLLGPRAKAYVGRKDGRGTSLEEDKSHICADCGASMTITGSLANTTEVVKKSVIVDMAENGTEMRSTHSCMKTYFIKNRSGETISITTLALYVKSVIQDLLSGKACNQIKIRIILDEDPDISGLYPLDKDKQQRIEDSIPFICEPADLFLLKLEELDWRKFHEINGFRLWHRRLRETIPYVEGLEKLVNYQFSDHEECSECMRRAPCKIILGMLEGPQGRSAK